MARSTHIRKYKYDYNSPGGTSVTISIPAGRIDPIGTQIGTNHGTFFVETKVICCGTVATAHGVVIKRAQFIWYNGSWSLQNERIGHTGTTLSDVEYFTTISPPISISYNDSTSGSIKATITFGTPVAYAQAFVDIIGIDY
jgi:hypothetical protein